MGLRFEVRYLEKLSTERFNDYSVIYRNCYYL